MFRYLIVCLLIGSLVGCSKQVAHEAASSNMRQLELGQSVISDGTAPMSHASGQRGESSVENVSWYISTVDEEDIAEADELERKIIYDADVYLVVDDFEGVDEQINQLIQAAGGYKSRVSITSDTGESRSGTWVARIPSDRYEQFLRDLADLGVPESIQQQTDDVTAEFIDIEEQLKTKRELEDRIRRLVDEREGDIEDVLSAERELARIRGEIESMEGRLRYLTNQTALSTVTINVREERDYVPPQAPSLGGRIASTWFGSLSSLKQFGQAVLLVIVALAPWLAVLVVVCVPLVLVWRARRRRLA